MRQIAELLFDILKELKIINRQLREMTGKTFTAGRGMLDS